MNEDVTQAWVRVPYSIDHPDADKARELALEVAYKQLADTVADSDHEPVGPPRVVALDTPSGFHPGLSTIIVVQDVEKVKR